MTQPIISKTKFDERQVCSTSWFWMCIQSRIRSCGASSPPIVTACDSTVFSPLCYNQHMAVNEKDSRGYSGLKHGNKKWLWIQVGTPLKGVLTLPSQDATNTLIWGTQLLPWLDNFGACWHLFKNTSRYTDKLSTEYTVLYTPLPAQISLLVSCSM